jgi:spore coat polysaccharide biosynthesis protein SpsF
MTHSSDYKTTQEAFWAGSFGTEYIARNDSNLLLASNLKLFSKALTQAGKISSCMGRKTPALSTK